MQIDDLDRKILQHLRDDGRVSYVTLANEFAVSEGTIRKRVRKLEENQVLQIVGVTDPFKVGMDTVAFIWLKVERNKLECIINEVKTIKEIRYLVITTGSYDVVAMAVLPNRERLIQLLNKQLGQIPGVQSTETSIVLEIHKQIYHWSPFDQVAESGGDASVEN
ncbi:MAG TPA: Lrp/AsnC family transcriptional regulator [Firmicutes bacterium]|nr:Lrp/AsnC family transcriptional regulator [Bacillota bacterium]